QFFISGLPGFPTTSHFFPVRHSFLQMNAWSLRNPLTMQSLACLGRKGYWEKKRLVMNILTEGRGGK
ncbi:unnamed protein product, partial [Gulo gulo]